MNLFQVKKREFVAGAADKDNPDKVTQINEGDYNCANIAYDLYKLDDNGEFKLRYGYKAVFDEISAYAHYLTKKVGDEYVYELDENNEKIPILSLVMLTETEHSLPKQNLNTTIRYLTKP